jgi:hypothetical protein
MIGKPRERPLGRQKHRWKVNIKVGNRKTGSGNVKWVELSEDRVQQLNNIVMIA